MYATLPSSQTSPSSTTPSPQAGGTSPVLPVLPVLLVLPSLVVVSPPVVDPPVLISPDDPAPSPPPVVGAEVGDPLVAAVDVLLSVAVPVADPVAPDAVSEVAAGVPPQAKIHIHDANDNHRLGRCIVTLTVTGDAIPKRSHCRRDTAGSGLPCAIAGQPAMKTPRRSSVAEMAEPPPFSRAEMARNW